MKGPQKELMSLLGSGGWREEIAGKMGMIIEKSLAVNL